VSASANQTRRARIKPGERAQKDRIGTCTQARWAPNPAAQLQLRRQQVDPIWSGRQCQSPCAARMLRCGCRVRSVPSCRLRQDSTYVGRSRPLDSVALVRVPLPPSLSMRSRPCAHCKVCRGLVKQGAPRHKRFARGKKRHFECRWKSASLLAPSSFRGPLITAAVATPWPPIRPVWCMSSPP